LIFREPWLKCRLDLIDEYRANSATRERDVWFDENLDYFSAQIFGIEVLKEAVHDPETFRDGVPLGSQTFLIGKQTCPGFDPSFPPCRDWKARQAGVPAGILDPVRLWQSSLPAYQQWLQDNADVSAALTDPASTVLSKVSDAAMGKLFDGVWVSETDLAVDHP
jgi:hypothetical protein